MKTFEEAVALIFSKRRLPSEQSSSLVVSYEKEDGELATLLRSRFKKLNDEASANEDIGQFCAVLCQAVRDRAIHPEDALLIALCNGLMIGIEMEKPE